VSQGVSSRISDAGVREQRFASFCFSPLCSFEHFK